MSDLTQNRAVVRAFIEALDRQDLDAALACIVDDYAWQGNGPDGQTQGHGKENFRAAALAFTDALPDHRMEILDMVAEGDRVAIRLRESGHHTGTDFCGVKAAGAWVEWYPFDIFRIEAGKLAQEWFADDPYTIRKSLGLKEIG